MTIQAKIVTSFCGMGWIASREDFDLGMPCGSGLTERKAIADLLEMEDGQTDQMDQLQESLESQDGYYREDRCMRRLRKDFDVMIELNHPRLTNYICDGAERIGRECIPK